MLLATTKVPQMQSQVFYFHTLKNLWRIINAQIWCPSHYAASASALFFQEILPALTPYDVLYRLYPYNSFLPREGKQSVEDLLATFHLKTPNKHSSSSVQNVLPSPQDHTAQVRINYNGQQAQFQVRWSVNWATYLVSFGCNNLRLY